MSTETLVKELATPSHMPAGIHIGEPRLAASVEPACPKAFTQFFGRGLSCDLCTRWTQAGPLTTPSADCPLLVAARRR